MSSVKENKAAISNVLENKSKLPSIDLQEQVGVCAYYKAETRGFAPGCELDDWLAAEAEINASTTAR